MKIVVEVTIDLEQLTKTYGVSINQAIEQAAYELAWGLEDCPIIEVGPVALSAENPRSSVVAFEAGWVASGLGEECIMDKEKWKAR